MFINGVDVSKKFNREQLPDNFWLLVEWCAISEYSRFVNDAYNLLDDPFIDMSRDELLENIELTKQLTLEQCVTAFLYRSLYTLGDNDSQVFYNQALHDCLGSVNNV